MLRLHHLGRHSALAVVEIQVEGEVGRAGRHGYTVVLRHNVRVAPYLSEGESTTGGERVGGKTHDVFECVGVRHDDIHTQYGYLVVPEQVELLPRVQSQHDAGAADSRSVVDIQSVLKFHC